MAPWNATMKQFAGLVAGTQITKLSMKLAAGNSLTERELRSLAMSSIDRETARVIGEQFQKHGTIEGHVYLPNTLKWDDTPNANLAKTAFRSALARDVDRTINTVGQDKPLFMSRDAGGMIMQFQSFGISSMQRTVMAGLQERDAGVVMGALMAVGLGALVTYVRAYQNDKPLPKTTAQWVADSIDRSGLTGYFFNVNNAVERLTANRIGVAALTGKTASRFASHNLAASLVGPTFGLVEDLAKASSGAFTKDGFTEHVLSALRRAIPFQNLFYLSRILRELEENAIDNFGIRRASPKARFP
jgi:hypothetical protein